MIRWFGHVLISSVFLMQCNSAQQGDAVANRDLKEPLIEANRTITEIESAKIDNYVKRRKWKVETSGTGLRYFIYQKGDGEQAQEGRLALVHYEITLLDGTLCYTSANSEPRQFRIGQDHVESGIHEGITYMRVGDRAKFVLPSHLAHGLTGDQKKIPPRSVLVIDLQLLALN